MSILNIRHSISGTRDYLTCPRLWWLKRIAHVEQEVSVDSYRGQLMHAGLAAGYAEMHRAQHEREGWLHSVIERRCEAAVEFAIDKESVRLKLDDYDGEVVDTACRALHHLGPRYGDVLIGVEYDMDLRIDGVAIGYRADVIYRRDGLLTVRDWKSAKTLPKARDLHLNWQLALGALCAARTFGDTLVRVEIASIGSAVAVGALMPRSSAQDGGAVVVETAGLMELELKRPTPFAPEPGEACAECPVRRHCTVYAEPGTVAPTPYRDGSPALTTVIEVGA